MGVYIQETQSTSHQGPPQSSWRSECTPKPGPVLIVHGCGDKLVVLSCFSAYSFPSKITEGFLYTLLKVGKIWSVLKL